MVYNLISISFNWRNCHSPTLVVS